MSRAEPCCAPREVVQIAVLLATSLHVATAASAQVRSICTATGTRAPTSTEPHNGTLDDVTRRCGDEFARHRALLLCARVHQPLGGASVHFQKGRPGTIKLSRASL